MDQLPSGEEFSVFVALGSNLGDRITNLRSAVRLLKRQRGIRDVVVSPVYESEAHVLEPGEKQPNYLNAVLSLKTSRTPEDMMTLCLEIERLLGRVRGHKWAPRTIDVDLLVYGRVFQDRRELKLPHPRMAERSFVLKPLADIAPDLYVPRPFDTTVSELLSQCKDNSQIRRTEFLLDEG